MSTNDSLIGQLDLLMLPGSRMQMLEEALKSYAPGLGFGMYKI